VCPEPFVLVNFQLLSCLWEAVPIMLWNRPNFVWCQFPSIFAGGIVQAELLHGRTRKAAGGCRSNTTKAITAESLPSKCWINFRGLLEAIAANPEGRLSEFQLSRTVGIRRRSLAGCRSQRGLPRTSSTLCRRASCRSVFLAFLPSSIRPLRSFTCAREPSV